MREFVDRVDAGRRLGARVSELLGNSNAVVAGLPRGGVPVANEVARVLHCPLEVIVVRKVGVPGYPEFAMGAIGEGGVVVVERETVDALGVSSTEFARAVADERAQLERRVRRYRHGKSPVGFKGEVVIIVDDGLATGATARAACEVARASGATQVILAVPVTSASAAKELSGVADRVISLVCVEGPFAVGERYENFDQTSDEEVDDLLAKARRVQLATAALTPPRGG